MGKLIIKEEKSITIINELETPLLKLQFCFDLIKEIVFGNDNEKLFLENNDTEAV